MIDVGLEELHSELWRSQLENNKIPHNQVDSDRHFALWDKMWELLKKTKVGSESEPTHRA